MNNKILIIEDDKAIVRLMEIALKTNGYESVVANSGIEGISLFLNSSPNLVLLDMGLPDIDGSDVLEQIRAMSNTPVIIVSARDREQEKVNALDNGANDYITKPFNVGELLARIRVAFRLVKPVVKEDYFSLDYLNVDFIRRRVTIDGEEVHLTPIEYKLLKLLIDNKGKVLTHSFINKEIWGYDTEDDYQSLRVFMATLRRKIEKNTSNPRFILTEVGIGYRMNDE